MIQVDLNKSAGALRLSLEKAGIVTPPTVELCFDLDVSRSYEDEHLDGITNNLMTRLVPWGMVFDPDKKLDVFTFSDGESHAYYVGDVNSGNYSDFVRSKVIGRVPGWNGGTDYAPVLRKNLELFGWIESAAKAQPKRGLFGGLFGSKPAPAAAEAPVKRKSLVLFNTDGANSDQRETLQLFEQMQREGHGMYVLFLAVSNQGGRFEFLRDLSHHFSNCDVAVIRDVRNWVKKSDEEINEELITDKLLDFFKS